MNVVLRMGIGLSVLTLSSVCKVNSMAEAQEGSKGHSASPPYNEHSGEAQRSQQIAVKHVRGRGIQVMETCRY